MWVMLNDCFFSIVHKDCGPDELLVRARRPGDIQTVWPKAQVIRSTTTDYMFRAKISKREVAKALAAEVDRITYSNFKASVVENDLHRAYERVWDAMYRLQPAPPRRDPGLFDTPRAKPAMKAKKVTA